GRRLPAPPDFSVARRAGARAFCVHAHSAASACSGGASVMSAYRIKGVTLRAELKWLTENGKLERIRPRLSPPATALVENPPLPGSWIEGELFDEFVDALGELEGAIGVRTF